MSETPQSQDESRAVDNRKVTVEAQGSTTVQVPTRVTVPPVYDADGNINETETLDQVDNSLLKEELARKLNALYDNLLTDDGKQNHLEVSTRIVNKPAHNEQTLTEYSETEDNTL